MSYLSYNRSEGVAGWEPLFCVTQRRYSAGFVETVGYHLARSDFAIPRPSKRRTAAQLEADGVERSPESVRASKAAMRRLIYSLGPDRMLTLTYAENQEDYGVAAADFDRFRNSFRQAFPGRAFVAVPERQKRGAWHWHVALRGFVDVKKIQRMWAHGGVWINRGEKRKNEAGSGIAGLAHYMAKYMAKDLGQLGRSAYRVLNRKLLDKPLVSKIRFALNTIAEQGLPMWARLEAYFAHNAVAFFAKDGVYWRLHNEQNSSSQIYSRLGYQGGQELRLLSPRLRVF